jgi:hypothetical protein
MAVTLANYLTWLQSQSTGRVPPMDFGEHGTFKTGALASDRDVPTSPGETGQGSNPETSDQSTGGRIGLAAQLDDPTSVANVTLDVMGLLAGPIGSLALRAGRAAMASHNQATLTQGLRGEQGARLSSQRVSEALSQNNRGPVADPDDPTAVSLTPEDVDIATEAEQGDTGEPDGPTGGPGGNSGSPTGGGDSGNPGDFHRGGVIPDRQRRPGLEESITAQQGEYVVKLGPSKKYRRLLDAINADDPTKIKQQAKSLKEALTR